MNFCRDMPVAYHADSAHVVGLLYFRPTGENATESLLLRQRITVILIHRIDGYFMPKIGILKTFWERNL